MTTKGPSVNRCARREAHSDAFSGGRTRRGKATRSRSGRPQRSSTRVELRVGHELNASSSSKLLRARSIEHRPRPELTEQGVDMISPTIRAVAPDAGPTQAASLSPSLAIENFLGLIQLPCARILWRRLRDAFSRRSARSGSLAPRLSHPPLEVTGACALE